MGHEVSREARPSEAPPPGPSGGGAPQRDLHRVNSNGSNSGGQPMPTASSTLQRSDSISEQPGVLMRPHVPSNVAASARTAGHHPIEGRDEKSSRTFQKQPPPASPSARILPAPGQGAGRDAAPSKTSNIIDPNDPELQEWLIETNYYDHEYRAQFLDRRRKLRALREQQEQLIEEEAAESASRRQFGAGAVPFTSSTPAKSTPTPKLPPETSPTLPEAAASNRVDTAAPHVNNTASSTERRESPRHPYPGISIKRGRSPDDRHDRFEKYARVDKDHHREPRPPGPSDHAHERPRSPNRPHPRGPSPPPSRYPRHQSPSRYGNPPARREHWSDGPSRGPRPPPHDNYDRDRRSGNYRGGSPSRRGFQLTEAEARRRRELDLGRPGG